VRGRSIMRMTGSNVAKLANDLADAHLVFAVVPWTYWTCDGDLT
jgi:hypothetical protein